MEQVFEPPCSVEWIQSELDAACVDRQCELRIAWAPRLTVARVIRPDGITRDYAKYPVLFGSFSKFVRGRWYVRTVNGKLTTIGYQKTGSEVIPPGVKLTDIALPDVVHINHSIHQFVIERKLPDQTARKTHTEKQQIAKMKLGFDLFGPFPEEGIWDWFDYINQHKDGCCDLAAERGVHCVGLYREPNHDDLVRVRAALKVWSEQPAYKDPMMAAELAGQVRTRQLIEAQDDALLEILKEVRECEAIDKVAQERTRVIGGTKRPQHTTAY